MEMNRLDDYRNDPNWYSSLGEKLDKIHFRSGHLHTECNPNTGYCSTHYDKHDPYESISSLAKHLWQSDLGKLVVVAGGILLALGLLKTK